MNDKRKVEIFSAGCSICKEAIDMVNSIACPSCEVIVHDMQDATVSRRAKDLGIKTVPTVLIDGVIADCCRNRRVDEEALRKAGIGQPLT